MDTRDVVRIAKHTSDIIRSHLRNKRKIHKTLPEKHAKGLSTHYIGYRGGQGLL